MKYLRALQHLAATAMMLVLTIVTARLYLTLDRREKRLETVVTQTAGSLSQNLASQVHAELNPVTRQAAGLLADLRLKVDTLDVNRVNDTVSQVSAAIKPISDSAIQIDKALPDFLDCQQDENGVGNKGCLYYRYSDLSRSADVTLQSIANAAPGIAKSAETTSQAVAKAAPSIAASAAGIAATADKTLTELTKPKTLRQKIEAWVKFGVYAAAKFL